MDGIEPERAAGGESSNHPQREPAKAANRGYFAFADAGYVLACHLRPTLPLLWNDSPLPGGAEAVPGSLSMTGFRRNRWPYIPRARLPAPQDQSGHMHARNQHTQDDKGYRHKRRDQARRAESPNPVHR